MDFTLIPPEDTQINIHCPDGVTVTLDAIDLNDMLIRLHTEDPNQNILQSMCQAFFQEWGQKISLISMTHLLDAKNEILTNAKKNSYTRLESTGSSAQGTPSLTETSATSPSSTTNSKQKKRSNTTQRRVR